MDNGSEHLLPLGSALGLCCLFRHQFLLLTSVRTLSLLPRLDDDHLSHAGIDWLAWERPRCERSVARRNGLLSSTNGGLQLFSLALPCGELLGLGSLPSRNTLHLQHTRVLKELTDHML